jgi:hypothetical protein
MKKLLTLLAITFLTTSSLKAQTFDETVAYINAIFKENQGITYTLGKGGGLNYYVNGISATKEGKVTIYWTHKEEQKVDFDPQTNVPITSINVFRIYEWKKLYGDMTLLDAKGGMIGYFKNTSDDIDKRLKNAFTHLRDLSTYKADPFAD